MSADPSQVPRPFETPVAGPTDDGVDIGHANRTDRLDGDVLKAISEWFDQHGVAWAGTLGELSSNVGRTPEQVIHALEASPIGMLLFGIASSISHRSGSPTMVSLRRLLDVSDLEQRRAPETHPATVPASDAAAGPPENSVPHDTHLPDVPPEQDSVADNLNAFPEERSTTLAFSSLTPVSDSYDRRHSTLRRNVVAAFAFLVVLGLGATFLKTGAFRSLTSKASAGTFASTPDVAHDPKAAGATHDSDNSVTNLARLLEKSKAGDPLAQYTLGEKLLRGEGIARDGAQAIQWLQESAKRGNKAAQLELGKLYSGAAGIAKDNVQAYTWLTLLASQGDSEAQSLVRQLTPELTSAEIARVRWNLGEMYRQGIGVPQNHTIAYTWYVLAEAAGEKRSVASKAELASQMSPEQVSIASANAVRWLKRHQL
jgi:TPR repeat protein